MRWRRSYAGLATRDPAQRAWRQERVEVSGAGLDGPGEIDDTGARLLERQTPRRRAEEQHPRQLAELGLVADQHDARATLDGGETDQELAVRAAGSERVEPLDRRVQLERAAHETSRRVRAHERAAPHLRLAPAEASETLCGLFGALGAATGERPVPVVGPARRIAAASGTMSEQNDAHGFRRVQEIVDRGMVSGMSVAAGPR